MQLDRNQNTSGRGKYALLKLRKLDEFTEQGAFGKLAQPIVDAIKTLEDAGILDWGLAKTETEFFVVRLRDQFAGYALRSYADAADHFGAKEYAAQVREIAGRAGTRSQWCKLPD